MPAPEMDPVKGQNPSNSLLSLTLFRRSQRNRAACERISYQLAFVSAVQSLSGGDSGSHTTATRHCKRRGPYTYASTYLVD